MQHEMARAASGNGRGFLLCVDEDSTDRLECARSAMHGGDLAGRAGSKSPCCGQLLYVCGPRVMVPLLAAIYLESVSCLLDVLVYSISPFWISDLVILGTAIYVARCGWRPGVGSLIPISETKCPRP